MSDMSPEEDPQVARKRTAAAELKEQMVSAITVGERPIDATSTPRDGSQSYQQFPPQKY